MFWVISAEPLICTHQAFIFSSISAYPPWYQLVIFSLAILVPQLCLGGMLDLESGVIFFLLFYKVHSLIFILILKKKNTKTLFNKDLTLNVRVCRCVLVLATFPLFPLLTKGNQNASICENDNSL